MIVSVLVALALAVGLAPQALASDASAASTISTNQFSEAGATKKVTQPKVECGEIAFRWFDSIYKTSKKMWANLSLRWMTQCVDGRTIPYKLRTVLASTGDPGHECWAPKNKLIIGAHVYLHVFKRLKNGQKKFVWVGSTFIPCGQDGWSGEDWNLYLYSLSWPRRARFKATVIWQVNGSPDPITYSGGYVRPLKKKNLTYVK